LAFVILLEFRLQPASCWSSGFSRRTLLCIAMPLACPPPKGGTPTTRSLRARLKTELQRSITSILVAIGKHGKTCPVRHSGEAGDDPTGCSDCTAGKAPLQLARFASSLAATTAIR